MTAPTGAGLAERSIEVILASQAEGGAFIAGPGFSQYGYAWFRDGAFTAAALDRFDRISAAARFHDWAARLVLERRAGLERAAAAAATGRAPAPDDYLHCRYRVDGRPAGDDWPTFQLDGPGIWLWSLAGHAGAAGDLSPEVRLAARLAGGYLAQLWRLPSFDAWEEFPEHRHTSTLAADLAGLRALADIGEATPATRAAAGEIEAEVQAIAGEQGWLPKWRGNPEVDGSLLWLGVPYELFQVGDPAFAATLARIERDLVAPGGGVYRYRRDTYYGGGAWLLLAASLGRVYVRRRGDGDLARAMDIRAWIEAQADAQGHLPEQVSGHALQPEHIEPWRERWGEAARPLVWSHAFYLELLADLRAAGA